MRALGVLIGFLSLHHTLCGQSCNLKLSGKILDQSTKVPLSYASIMLSETRQGAVADEQGNYIIEEICPGQCHVLISHVGFEMDRFYVEINSDLAMDFELDHHEELLNEVMVHGEKAVTTTQTSNTINAKQIHESGNQNLADLLDGITGVSVIKNGSGVSKPVIHGLYGNRLKIINNGLAQTGQQWGLDHAPEIDPFIADHLSVVKGVAALKYIGGSIGGVVIVDPDDISSDPHVHGKANYIYQSNGQGHTANTQIEKAGKWMKWRATGTWKHFGDSRSPDYYLKNTGKRENNIALQLEKEFNPNWKLNAYYSFFGSEIGILKASHISNLTDLNNALEREQPIFTEGNFAYSINPPRQEVQHHLAKVQLHHQVSDRGNLTLTYGGQLNCRDEFDVRRGGRSGRPVLSLNLQSHFTEAAYSHYFDNQIEVRAGLQNVFINNRNDLGLTGTFPFIPNYDANTTGAYLVFLKNKNNFLLELGGRYDIRSMDVTRLVRGVPITIDRPDHTFQSFSISSGIAKHFTHNLKTSFNVGYTYRAPEVNELYSDGLHQGVATIERGNPTLETEGALKATMSGNLKLNEKFFFQVLGHTQLFDGYIYLQPTGTELTIRGSYPVSEYRQTDALIYGTDLLLIFEPYRNIKLNTSYSFLKGIDTDNSLPLIFMPANNITSAIQYSLADKDHLRNTTLGANVKYVFQQNEYAEGQDFQTPPQGYLLVGAKISSSFSFAKSDLSISLRVENLFNESYRDYLNRLRYFAVETGTNLIFSINYSF